MNRVPASFDRTIDLDAPIERVWELIGDVPALGRLLRMESVEAVGDQWRWKMRPVGGGGIVVQPTLTARVDFYRPGRITIVSVQAPGDSAAVDGSFDFHRTSAGTRVRARLQVGVDLPIPWFTVRLARAVVDRRVSHMADRFVERIAAS